MVDIAHPVTFRRYRITDYDAVAALWTRINRELAPPGMEELFEQYIATTINGELKQLLEVFSEEKRNAFWVVESAGEIVGCFGIESYNADDTDLRRMYLDKAYRGAGIAQRMLDQAQAEARALGFKKMILSTAEIQRSAVAFYRKSGFRQIRTETAETMNPKQAGGGLTRFYFEKEL
jgi:putative acetyltransferase